MNLTKTQEYLGRLANLKKVSKLKAEQKVGDKVEEVNKFIEAVEVFTN